jgi:glutathione S-transferase
VNDVTWTIYYASGACSLASHIALEQAGADYRAERVDFRVGAQRSPEYLTINPKGRVPALVTERGVITENPAILTFVAQSFPGSALALPADPFDVAQIQAIVSYFCSTVHPARSHRVRGARWADDPAAIAEMARKAPQVVADCFDLIEAKMLAGPWVMGEAYSICDPYLFTLASWLAGDGMDINHWPKVAAHQARMLEDPAVRRALDDERAQP